MNAPVCERKKRYPDEQAALDALALIIKQSMTGERRRVHSKDHLETAVYRCGYCDGWHLTSKALRPSIVQLHA